MSAGKGSRNRLTGDSIKKFDESPYWDKKKPYPWKNAVCRGIQPNGCGTCERCEAYREASKVHEVTLKVRKP